MQVKDKVYKVVRNHLTNKLFIQQYQILNIRRTGRLTCFRTNNNDSSKGQWSFSESEVALTPEEAISKYEKEINCKIAFNQQELQKLLDLREGLVILYAGE